MMPGAISMVETSFAGSIECFALSLAWHSISASALYCSDVCACFIMWWICPRVYVVDTSLRTDAANVAANIRAMQTKTRSQTMESHVELLLLTVFTANREEGIKTLSGSPGDLVQTIAFAANADGRGIISAFRRPSRALADWRPCLCISFAEILSPRRSIARG
jgi:hypothetical protein